MNHGNGKPESPAHSTMTRRELIQSAATAGLGLALPPLSRYAGGQPAAMNAGPSRKPNLLFVFSDQQSYDMLGCYGNNQVLTPSLDRFAREGIRFTHCISNHPVCTPYRSILMSGQHPICNGSINNDVRMIPEAYRLGNILKRAGYRMGYVGKWHLFGGGRDQPIPPGAHRHGFDDVFLSDNCTLEYEAEKSFFWNDAGEKVFFEAEHGWEVTAQSQQAEQFLAEQPADSPFCLFVSWHPPHNHLTGYATLPELMNRYDTRSIRPRPNCPPEAFDPDAYHGYMALGWGLYDYFGALMEMLEATGHADNTIVVYTSDHGDLLGSHAFPEHKAMPHEESVRVPFMLRWPGRVEAGQTSNTLMGALDLMPTLLGLLGQPIPEACQGQDLSDEISGDGRAGPDSQPLWHIYVPPRRREGRPAPHGWRGVRTPRHTYARAIGRGPWVLFDNQDDPWQLNNLIEDPAHQALLRDLDHECSRWMKRFGDPGWTSDQFMDACVDSRGIPRGRPIDVIRAIHSRSRTKGEIESHAFIRTLPSGE